MVPDTGRQCKPKELHAIGFVAEEIDRRRHLWAELLSYGSPASVPATLVKSLGIYGGQAGIYRDIKSTRANDAPDGVAVAVRHTGSSYADYLSADGMLYHYPLTSRPGRTDEAEVESAKAARLNAVPLFVVLGPKGPKSREVRLGYVDDFDDRSKILLITFTDEIVVPEGRPESAFELSSGEAECVLQSVQKRPNQQRFAIEVFKRYGPQCAVCSFDIAGVVQAAHIHPKSAHGSDDARNGLPLCANHHIALDRILWGIEPGTTRIVPTKKLTLQSLQIDREDLSHLEAEPHADALSAAWTEFNP